MTTPSAPDQITVTGAREHNLKDVAVSIPKNKLVVFTGLSGSGKSSLAFDTLYAEGQRRYVESLSSYARQFLGVMQKPDVDHIEGLSPAISIDQKTTSHNPRSTVGTITEIYDYMRLLYARVGHPHCPNCGKEVTAQSIDQIIEHIFEKLEQTAGQKPGEPIRFMVLSPVVQDRKGEFRDLFENLQKKGYQRVRIDGDTFELAEDFSLIKTNKHSISVMIDRLVTSHKQLKDQSERKLLRSRLNQSVEEALKLSEGLAMISLINDASATFPDNPKDVADTLYSEKRACSDCGISMPELEPRLFSFNSPQGACPECNGLGTLLKIDPEKMIAPALTLSEGAVIPFARTMSADTWWSRLVREVIEQTGFDFRKTAWRDMDAETHQLLLRGSKIVYRVEGENRHGKQTVIHETFEGFITNLERRYEETDSDYIRREIEQYMQKTTCPSCKGTRLTDEALGVHIDGKNIAEACAMAINDLLVWTDILNPAESEAITKESVPNKNTDIDSPLTPKEQVIAVSILKEIVARLSFLNAVGLDYLTLDREAATLAGGEAQRIRLASQIGTGLTGVLYILDEPTIGLHQRDNHRLIETLKNLQQKGNTVIVVEHDRDVMLAADHILDFGPLAGKFGGEIVAAGNAAEIMSDKKSLTGKYLARKKDVLLDKKSKKERRIISDDEELPKKSQLRISGASQHNLRNVDVAFPLGTFTCITGVSGSGKSTLLHDTLYNNLAQHLGKSIDDIPGPISSLYVPDDVGRVTLIDQSPIGKTPRSNPATYTKAFDYIRKVFANTQEAQVRGYKPGRFSFNVKGGRCEACQGDGQIKIEMQFLPDVYVTCDVCNGKRYNTETLEVTYKGKTIADVLAMTVDDAADFFKGHNTMLNKLKTMQAVGLGYIGIGQSAPTLSGGEAQRVKLAKELSTRTYDHVVYLLDEPTTGLHFADIQKLLQVLQKLVEQDNTVIVIEHNLDVIKNADWIIDLGPEGGAGGGEIIATGTPQQLAEAKKTFTGEFLAEEFLAMKKM